MRKLIKNILSYFWGMHVEQLHSKLNGELNVFLVNGKYILNAKNGNYSYGVLHKGFRKIFKLTGIKNRNIKNCLVLGFGAGSVVSILHEELKISCRIKAIDLDPEVIRLGEKYFNINRFKKLDLIVGDAFNFVKNEKSKYDLIVFDIYIDTQIPEPFEGIVFLKALEKIMAKNGILLYNKDLSDEKMKQNLSETETNFKAIFKDVKKINTSKDNMFFVVRN